MKKSAIICYILSSVLFLVFAVFTIMVKFVDVSAVNASSTGVGFSHLNNALFNFFGASSVWDKITDALLIFALLIAVCFVFIGILQLIKRKSIAKVDKEILLLGAIYILLAISYILFELVVINFRPVLVNGQLEASYPSSHTLFVCTILLTSGIVFNHYLKSKIARIIYDFSASLISVLMVVGRLLSGMHWFTDVVASIILSLAFVTLYIALIKTFQNRKPNNQKET